MKNYQRGPKMATVELQNGVWVVWVGFSDPIEGTIPARHFKRHSTCSNEYKTEAAAVRAAEKFINA